MADKTVTSDRVNPSVVKIGSESGHSIINKNSPLRRLNYFDGKFLRAPDLILEQQAILNQIRFSNQAGGDGVVHGYDCTLGSNDNLNIGGGLAIDISGHVLLLANSISVGINELIDKSRTQSTSASGDLATETSATNVEANLTGAEFDDCVMHAKTPPGMNATDNNELYVITINHSEAYCGEEDVYGKLCSEACTTSTNRSYIIQGIEVRAIPLSLSVLLKQSASIGLSQQHLRSRVASAYYEQERQLLASHISAQGLTSNIWCLGAEAANGNGVPIAVIGRNGNTTLFLDAWTARRERIDAPPRHYWAARMAMRPWKLYLAQILQFQCQLHSCFLSKDPNSPCKRLTEFDPCSDSRKVAAEAAQGMRYLIDSMTEAAQKISTFNGETNTGAESLRSLIDFDGGLTRLEEQYQNLIDAARIVVPNRLLINCGIVEVPSAGYLPVNASSTVTVNEQVQRLMGEGVDLRFCVVRPDFVAHALEEAQHMERICLLTGIDDPSQKPKLDVLVPNGEIIETKAQIEGQGYQAKFTINAQAFEIGWPREVFQTLLQQAQQAELATSTEVATSSLRTNIQSLQINQAFMDNVSRSLPNMSGAARGEKLESDGIAFYMAVQSGQEPSAYTSTLSVANRSAQQILQLLDGQPADQPQEAAATETNIDLNSMGIQRLSSGLRINSQFTDALQTSRLIPSTAMWVNIKTLRDPFSLNRGEQTDIQGKFISVIIDSSQRLIIEERIINGQLQITKSAPSKPDTELTARLIADGSWRTTTSHLGQTNTRYEPVKFDDMVTISRTSVTGLPSTISIIITNPSFFAGLGNVRLVFQRIWISATESRARTSLRFQKAAQNQLTLLDQQASLNLLDQAASRTAFDTRRSIQSAQEIILAECILREDSAVLEPGNEFHNASLNALTNIAKATNDKSFTDQASNLLFPPQLPVAEQIRILAKESWVLFHRRRDKVCAQKQAEQIIVKPRDYRVYHIHLDAATDTTILIEALEADASAVIANFDHDPVGIVEYAPGINTVATNHGDVREDWKAAVQVDAAVHIGLIASQGDALDEGEVLAQSRLESLTNVLSPVSETADDLTLLTVTQVPATLAAGEVDGVIVYFTKAVATICHDVFRLLTRSTDDFMTSLDGYLANPTAESLMSFLQNAGADVLSSRPRFIEQSDTYYGENEAQQLAASWDLFNNGPVSGLVALSHSESTEQQQMTVQQATHISQTVDPGDAPDTILYRPTEANVFKQCPKSTVLIAETECNEVYFFAPITNNPEVLLQGFISLIQNVGISSEILGLDAATGATSATAFTRFSDIDFYRDTDQFEVGSRDQFSLKWQTELSGTPPTSINGFFVVVARPGSTAEETAANLQFAKEQGEMIQALMAINSSTLVAVTNNADVEFPSDCKALTFLVIPQEIGFVVAGTTYMAMAYTTDTSSTGAVPELSLNLANSVKYDVNNDVIRDTAFNTAVNEILASGTQVNTLEMVSIENVTDSEAEIRADALITILKEEGAATNDATIVKREASTTEKIEIVRSGFILNNGMLLK